MYPLSGTIVSDQGYSSPKDTPIKAHSPTDLQVGLARPDPLNVPERAQSAGEQD